MTGAVIRHPGELRWETRLLGVVTAILVVFGIASTYGAASLQTNNAGDSIGFGFALRQATGAALGGILLLVAARLDYHLWQKLAWVYLREEFQSAPCWSSNLKAGICRGPPIWTKSALTRATSSATTESVRSARYMPF